MGDVVVVELNGVEAREGLARLLDATHARSLPPRLRPRQLLSHRRNLFTYTETWSSPGYYLVALLL